MAIIVLNLKRRGNRADTSTWSKMRLSTNDVVELAGNLKAAHPCCGDF
jgi:hypothetical protein